jgi:LPS O-antigen subunit length determinant protein (WzzB/FepE family)
VSTPLWQPGQSAALVVAIGLLGGLLVAATVAALTDLALLRLVWGR